MSQLPWLPKYSGETTDELVVMEQTFRTDSVVAAFEKALHQKSYRIGGFGSLTKEERVVLAVEALEREVNNGGYHQYLRNTSDELIADVVGALHCIRRSDLAMLTQRAIDAVADDGETKKDLLSPDRVAALSRCDSDYFRVAGDLAEPLFKFIKQARAHIVLP